MQGDVQKFLSVQGAVVKILCEIQRDVHDLQKFCSDTFIKIQGGLAGLSERVDDLTQTCSSMKKRLTAPEESKQNV